MDKGIVNSSTYHYRAEHHLIIALSDIQKQESLDVAYGEAQFAFGLADDALLFFYKFGSTIDWSDSHFNYHLWGGQSDLENFSSILHIHLYDWSNRQSSAERLIEFPENFSENLKDAFIQQREHEFDAELYLRNIQAKFSKYQPTELLLRYASHSFGVPSCY